MVTPIARRRPQKFANETVTLDHLSGGRLIVGVGLGFPPDDEFAAFGEEAGDRVRADRTDEALDVVVKLWTGQPVVHEGAFLSVSAHLRPSPLQQPRPPVWVALLWPNRRPLVRARRWNGVVPLSVEGEPLDPAGIAAVVEALGPVKPGFEVVAAWTPGHDVADFEAAGATWLIESRWPAGDWLGELEASANRHPTR
jgi:alkanesulfonate monooxygenase SsuD/methylene tetrahydromethanopterin reductase-like flavin-dependent oxidoreductase (luciferase family)